MLTSLVYEVTGSANNTGNGGGAEVGGRGGFLGDGRPVDHQSRLSGGTEFRIKIHLVVIIIIQLDYCVSNDLCFMPKVEQIFSKYSTFPRGVGQC